MPLRYAPLALAALGLPALAHAQPFASPFYGLFTGSEVHSRFNVNVTAADLDGDGLNDLVVARNVYAGGFTLLMNAGDGLFEGPAHFGPVVGGPGPTPPAGVIRGTWNLEPGDFDEDGDVDLLATNSDGIWNGSTLSLWRNLGGGTFASTADTTHVGDGGPIELDAADFNADGHLDVAVTRYGFYQEPDTLSVFLGDGTGAFGAPAEYPVFHGNGETYVKAGDLDGDGDLDLAVTSASSDSLGVLLGDGAGAFAAATYAAGAAPVTSLRGLALADVDNDGDLDAVAPGNYDHGWNSGTLVVFRNGGAAAFTAEVVRFGATANTYIDGANDLVVEDFDGDGWVDAVGTIYGGSISGLVVLRGDGAGGFEPARRAPSVANTFALAAADVTGDGATDLLVVDRLSPVVAVHPNEAGISLFTPPAFTVAYADRVALGDLDGDGDLDAATSNGGGNSGAAATLLRNLGGGAFETAQSVSGPVTDARLRDLNGDGRADLVAAAGARFVFALANADGTVGARTEVDLGACDRGMADALDVDGDGDLDAVVGEADGCNSPVERPRVLVALNDGAGAFGAPIASPISSTAPSSLPVKAGRFAAGDFDADGDLDLVFTDYTTTVLLGNGDGTFQEPVGLASDERLPFILAADVSGDGALDLVTAGGLGGPFGEAHATVRLGDGLGGFGPEVRTHIGPGISGLTAGDVDQDGDLDLLVSLREINSAAFLQNDGAGGFTLPAYVGVAWLFSGGAFAEVSGDGLGDLVGLYSLPPGGFGTAFLTMVRGQDLRGTTTGTPGAPGAPVRAEALALSAPYPNPARGLARLDLAVRDAQRVRVEAFDVTGRRVAVLFDGRLEAGAAQPVLLDGAALPAGVYVVRAAGEAGAAVQRVTLVR